MNKFFFMLLTLSAIACTSHAAEWHLTTAERHLTRATPADVQWSKKYENDNSVTYSLKLKNYPNIIAGCKKNNGVGMAAFSAWESVTTGFDVPIILYKPLSPRFCCIVGWLHNQHESAKQEHKNG